MSEIFLLKMGIKFVPPLDLRSSLHPIASIIMTLSQIVSLLSTKYYREMASSGLTGYSGHF